ncbi:MAG: RNA polymerase sigma factor, partial [Streptosporangiaceae bacterium]
MSALAQLPALQRDVLLLAASGLSHDEIATALGVRPGTVGSRLSRGRRTLQRALGGANPARSREECTSGNGRDEDAREILRRGTGAHPGLAGQRASEGRGRHRCCRPGAAKERHRVPAVHAVETRPG